VLSEVLILSLPGVIDIDVVAPHAPRNRVVRISVGAPALAVRYGRRRLVLNCHRRFHARSVPALLVIVRVHRKPATKTDIVFRAYQYLRKLLIHVQWARQQLNHALAVVTLLHWHLAGSTDAQGRFRISS
jgi:hypothetical protein